MKKILTVSLVAMMAVSTARADLASTAYVDDAATAATAAAVSEIETSHNAVLTSGITEGKVAQIQQNTDKFADYSTTEQMNTAINNKVTELNLSGTYAEKSVQTAVENQTTGLAATYALAEAAQTADEVATAINNKVTELNLPGTYAEKSVQTAVEDQTTGLTATYALAESALQKSALEDAAQKAASQGDGTYALTMKVVNNAIVYQWDLISYPTAQ